MRYYIRYDKLLKNAEKVNRPIPDDMITSIIMYGDDISVTKEVYNNYPGWVNKQ